VAPTNVNIVVRVDSPGNDGPVTQTNTSGAAATSGNQNATSQQGTQTQTGGAGASGGQSQTATQAAPTTQSSNASATSTQVAPTNVNIVIRNKSPGDDRAVTQTNSSNATAGASNANQTTQTADQSQSAASGSSSSGQSQTLTQSAPTMQTADGTATSVQSSPTNAGVSVLVDPDAPDPAGSGAHGTLIQIWLPREDRTPTVPGADATQATTSSAAATSSNTNQTTQTASQQQVGGKAGGNHLGGAGQAQSISQSAPTTPTSTAAATSTQSGVTDVAAGGSAAQNTSSTASAAARNDNATTQSANQAQSGDGSGAGQSQVIDQSAPTTQIAVAGATSTQHGATNVAKGGSATQTSSSSSTVSAGNANATSQAAHQSQDGEAGGEQAIAQSAPVKQVAKGKLGKGKRHLRLRALGKLGARTIVPGGSAAARQPWSAPRAGGFSDPGSSEAASRGGASKPRPGNVPRDDRPPTPRDPTGLGAASGFGPEGGTSFWVFAALVLPFALSVPLGTRRQGSSAIRRLASVVLRPERPG
jgi:hypothetical protein